MKRTTTEAFVLRRYDFQESSRIVTLFTRALGRVSCLAKGAHRDKSPFLGALDTLLWIEADVAVRTGDLHLLTRARVLGGNSGFLAARARWETAFALAGLWLSVLPDGRSDPEAFDLFKGGLILVEKAPLARLAQVELALELKLLAGLGLLAELTRCASCGAELTAGAALGGSDGMTAFHCPHHRLAGTQPLAPATRTLMAALVGARGRDVPAVQAPAGALRESRAAADLLLTRLLDRPVVLRR